MGEGVQHGLQGSNHRFGTLPPDIDKSYQALNNNYTDVATGWNQVGYAAAKIINALGDACVGIELGNEPNQATSGWGGTEVPTLFYAAMGAYIIHWVYTCCGGLDANGELKKKVLLGAVASSLKNTDVFTQGLTPMAWTIQMANYVKIILQGIYPNQQGLVDILHNAWRLSIHPYPDLGRYKVVVNTDLHPTASANDTGDLNGQAAFGTVWNLISAYLSQFGSRKLWITETGVSSKKINEQEQAAFFQNLANAVSWRYALNDKRIEGWINWGFSDLDPGVHTEGVVPPGGGPSYRKPDAPFFQLGVIKGNDGVTHKPAATALETIFNGIWA